MVHHKEERERIQKIRIIENLFKYKGAKSLVRILLNTRVEDLDLKGLILDLGSGKREPLPSYYNHIKNIDKNNVISINVIKNNKPDILANLEVGIPLKDKSVDYILMFNLLEHIYDYKILCSEVYRVLKKDGKCYTYVPFLIKIHEDPCDYFRYSEHALYRIFKNTGFSNVSIENLGFGAFTAFWYFFPSYFRKKFLFKFPHLIVFPICLKIDEFIDYRTRKNGAMPFSLQYPLAYFVTCEKRY